MSQDMRQSIIKYSVAVGIVVVVTILKLLIINQFVVGQQWFLMFTAAICVSSWYGGYGPGVVTAILSAFSAALFFVPPTNATDLSSPAILFQLLFFLLEGLLTVGFTGNLRETRAKAIRDEQTKDEALAQLDTFQVYAPVGLAFLDKNLRYMRINYAMAELAGLTPAAHIGRTLQEVNPALSQQTIDNIRQVLMTGKPLLDQEVTVTRSSLLGMKKQSFLTSYYRMRSADGQTLGVGIVTLDITERKQAEDVLRESEARFRAMADTAPVLIWLADEQQLRTYFNQGWLDFTGQTMRHELGHGWEEHVHPDDLRPYLETYSNAFHARQPFETEYRLRRKDGVYRTMLSHGVPRFTPEGEFAGFIGISIDITERKHLELGQQFALDAGVALAASLDYEVTLNAVVKLAVPNIADWCAIDLLTPENTIQRVAVAHIDPEKVKWAYEIQQRFPPDLNASNGVGLVLRTGETEFVADVPSLIAPIYDTLTDEMKQVMDKLQAVSVITAPLTARGKTIGALTFATAESGRRYNQTDVQIAETLATRAALAVDNARLYGESRAERERFRVTLSSIGDAVIATDAQSNVSFINQVAQELTGWTEDQALHQPLDAVFKIINEQTRQAVESPAKRVLREGVVVGLANHTILVSRTGKETPIDDSGAPIPDEAGKPSGVILVFRDVSERKREEERQEFLIEASQLLSSSLDYQTTLQELTQLTVPVLADWCAVDVLTSDRQRLERVSVAHVDPEKVRWAYELMQRYPLDLNGDSMAAKTIREGTTTFFPEVGQDIIEGAAVNSEMYEILQQLALTSEIIVPLIARGQTLGMLTLVYAESKRHYTQTDVNLAQQLAGRAALAVDNARLYSEAQAERERFRVTLTSIGDAVIATDLQGRVSFMNQIAQTLTGWVEREALGQPLDDVFRIINEQTHEPVENPVKRVLREGTVVGLANHTVLVSKSGQETAIDDSGAPIPADDGSSSGVVLVFRDVSERKRAERRQQFLVDATQLLSSSLDYQTTLTNLVNSAVPTIADWCAVDLLADDGNRIERLAVAHFAPERTRWAYEMSRINPQTMEMEGGLQRVIRSGKSEYIPLIPEEMLRAAASSDEEYQLIQSLGLKSYIVVPLTARGRTFGAFSLVSAESGRLYTEADVTFMEQLASRAALAVDNARLYSQAQAERERFRVTLASIGDAVIATDAEGKVSFINQVAQNLTGWSDSDALGQPLDTVFKIINEQTRERVESPIKRVLAEGVVVGLANHTILVSRTGTETPIDDSGAPIPGENNSASGVVLVFRDVTQRKLAESRQQFLVEAGNLLISSLDYEATLREIVRLAVPSLADWAVIYLRDESGSVRQAEAYHTDPQKIALREEMMRRYVPSPDHPHGYPRVFTTGEPELLTDLDQQLKSIARDAEHLRYLRAVGYTSSLTVPLKERERTFGAFALAMAESKRAFHAEDMALLQEFSKIASLAITNARLYARSQGNTPSAPNEHDD